MNLAKLNGRLDKAALVGSLEKTTELTSMVVFLLVGSTAFALVFRGLYGDVFIEDLLTNLPGGKIGLLVVANLVIFVLGFFIDFFEIAFIILPLLVPARTHSGHRHGLVRRDDWHEPADQLPDPTLRLLTVLSAGCGAQRDAHVCDLQGGAALHRHSGGGAAADHRVPRSW